ncbi:uncharacterized protein LOC130392718 [Gadus chalcogrammus]|uniref:uncharacterized protein LOC130392716 n=3 Tax=Gadus TaxID=8048 RepID=UPI0024C36B52|nr:uncharacterized protein LOC130372953 isoform X1 [Gadus chalcogrammus]XP_056449545.1 uncharacterized protein LOC130385196 isoform X1 [Gadus chalcogrammus]XP_056451229.1 uncharacterized protein LOC130386366 isoform X1 [Gadus chalcogrammus]XP_056459197.1 uncharacterized protein LOC130392716 [Gadus chalcogrammus]XP_056459198.1 uncharacterized protein LOC130392718 [Gadus chalcogrammus]
MRAPRGGGREITTNMAAAEHVDEGDTEDDAQSSTEVDDGHPWSYLESMFSYLGMRANSYRMKCMLCLPKCHEIKAFKSSPSNLKKHIQRAHPQHLKKYEQLTSQKRKRASEAGTSTLKQTTLLATRSISQSAVDRAIVKYVVNNLQPLSTVENEAFRELLTDLLPTAKVITRVTLRSRIEDLAKSMKNVLTEEMSKVDHIATTTDCWSVRRRSFLGVTAHWVNSTDLTRRSAALACRQLRGSHTFDVLATALNDIHTEYGIRNKVVRTTTDNGSNFLKAFQVFSVDKNNNEAEEKEDEEGNEMEGVEFVDMTSILVENDGFEFELPKHQRCACHLLNLVSTVDAEKATANDGYKKLQRSTFSKCYGLWNKCGRSCQAAEAVEDACSLQLLRPNATRWNSMFMAVERLLKILREKGEPALREICAELKVPMFHPVELTFLKEYYTTMSPVAQSINILQGEVEVQMGWLLPTISLLSSKLEKIKIALKHCKPLVEAIQVGIQNRFGEMSRDPELVAAAILIPKFKTAWIKDDATLKNGLDYIREQLEDPSISAEAGSGSSDEGDFFHILKSSHKTPSATKQLDSYLAYSTDDIKILKTFPVVLKLSVKLNTPLPASAACERLFSIAGLIFSPKRARLAADTFENQLLLRMNRKFNFST